MPLEQLSNNLDFFSYFIASKVGCVGLTVTVDVWKHLTSTNASSQIITAGSATEVGGGLYRYQLSSASVTGEGEYICIFKTSSATPDQKEIPSIWCVQKAGSEYLDAAVTSRPSGTDYTTSRAGYLDRLDTTISSRQASGNVTIAGYAAGQDPATLVWAASTRTLSGFGFSVTVGTNNDKTGYALSVVPPTAQQIWDTLTSALTTAGSVGKRIADNLDVTVSSRQVSGNVTIAGYAAGQDPVTLTGVTTTRAAKLDNLDVAVSTGAAPAIWNYLTASATTAASLGKLLVDNVNATVASRMATFTYTAPDNTSIGTILGRTDVATSTRASATDFTTARAAKLDNLDATVSSRLVSGNVTVAGYASGQDPVTLTGVTTTRAAKLDNLDATISSRLAPAGITSLQADVTAIKTPVVVNIDATISSRLASAAYTASSITSLQADVTAIKSTVDTNLNATISSRLAPAGITSLQADVTSITGNVSPGNSAIYSKVSDAIYYATDARDKALLNYQVLYGVTTPAGSVSANLNAVKSTVDTNLNATVSSRLAASAYQTAVGQGAVSYTATLYQPGTTTPIVGAEIWVTSNSTGTTVVAGTLSTNSSGQATFMLDAGSYYLWVQAAGWNFTNPQAFVVS